jgi:RNA-binding protein YlmH
LIDVSTYLIELYTFDFPRKKDVLHFDIEGVKSIKPYVLTLQLGTYSLHFLHIDLLVLSVALRDQFDQLNMRHILQKKISLETLDVTFSDGITLALGVKCMYVCEEHKNQRL